MNTFLLLKRMHFNLAERKSSSRQPLCLAVDTGGIGEATSVLGIQIHWVAGEITEQFMK